MRAGGGLAQQRLELGEVPGSSPGQALRDGIEIGAAGGQVARECALGLDDFADDRALVARRIVHEDKVAGLQGGGEEPLHPGLEHLAIHRPIQRYGRAYLVMAQACDEGRHPPMAIYQSHTSPPLICMRYLMA